MALACSSRLREGNAPAIPVAFTRCADYDPSRVAEAVDRAVGLAGGWDRYVTSGQTVLIKPNLLTDAPPEAAKTTHPEVVRAIIRAVRRRGAVCAVGDSPAGVMKLARVWQVTGMRQVCEEEGVDLVSFEEGGAVPMERDGIHFAVARRVLDADLVINVPKVKTHVLTSLTCGVKNLYGCVPGMRKVSMHRDYFQPKRFGAAVAAVYSAVKPGLTIADGIVGMDGNGPSAGRRAAFGFVAATPDAVALDVCLCRILGIAPRAVPYLAALAALQAGETRLEHVAVLGATLESLRPESVRLPNTLKARLVPQWLVRLFAPLVWCRPSFSSDCVRCGLCARSCPVGALTLDKGADRPRLDAKACIDCCCCHEVCPVGAVSMRPGPLLRLAMRPKTRVS